MMSSKQPLTSIFFPQKRRQALVSTAGGRAGADGGRHGRRSPAGACLTRRHGRTVSMSDAKFVAVDQALGPLSGPAGLFLSLM